MPKLIIDGKEIEVTAGTTIIQAAEKLGIDIPRYCYHPALPVSGNCRICMVEVEKQAKPQIACYTPVAEGMVVKTNSPKVVETRKTVLEFLLVNHPVDCPVCDQAGECKLQDYYMEHGQYNSRLVDVKVKKSKKAFSIGPNVMLDQERCILCTRCVRFSDHITKTSELGVFDRGDHSQLDVYPGKQVDHNYSGNVVDICPVGALTDKDFRFKCRVWYLEHTKSVCPGCSMGCNIFVDWDKSRPHQDKKDRVMRLKPRHNPHVNDYWMCDQGRYDYKFIDANRIQYPQAAEQLLSWEEAISRLAKTVSTLKNSQALNRAAIIASPKLTNEDLFLMRKLFVEQLGIQAISFAVPDQASGDHMLLKPDRNPNTAGAQAILPPSSVETTRDLLHRAQNGDFDLLYVFGHDLVKYYGKDLISAIAKKVKLFVLQTSNLSDTATYAHLVLPSAVYAEKEGTFTNCQKRVQRIWPAFQPLAQAKTDAAILQLLAQKLQIPVSYTSAQDIFSALAREHGAFSEMSYEKIADQGMILKA